MKTLKISLIALALFVSQSAFANERPFWTEKSTYEEGDKFFIVGVGSNQPTIEDARMKATLSAEREIQTYLVTDRAVSLDTQMTFEETNEGGLITVFRLFSMPLGRLVALKAELKAERSAPTEKVDQVCHAKPSTRKNMFDKTLTVRTFIVSCDQPVGQALVEIQKRVVYLEHMSRTKDPHHKTGFNCVSIASDVACD